MHRPRRVWGRRAFLLLLGAMPFRLLSAGQPSKRSAEAGSDPLPVRLALCGDVMTGRGIDQILPHSCDPQLYEPWVRDAREYVRLAERRSGPIPAPVGYSYPWGDALEALDRFRPDATVVNLETSVTLSSEPWPGKSIHYRMHPRNVPLLTEAGVDCCVLGNNHVLDWGRAGLEQTLSFLRAAGLRVAGAGRNLAEASSPAVIELGNGVRLLVFSFGARSSGIPGDWAARATRSGVWWLEELSAGTVREIASRVREVRGERDLTIASIHWGGNWGYEIPAEHRSFAHRLIDEAGIDLVHGHSSHHPMGIEVYRGRLVLYGCGDFLNDYEGIEGYERFRPELTLLYLARLDPATGDLSDLELVPLRIQRFRVVRTSAGETRWLRDLLRREGRELGTGVRESRSGVLGLTWGA